MHVQRGQGVIGGDTLPVFIWHIFTQNVKKLFICHNFWRKTTIVNWLFLFFFFQLNYVNLTGKLKVFLLWLNHSKILGADLVFFLLIRVFMFVWVFFFDSPRQEQDNWRTWFVPSPLSPSPDTDRGSLVKMWNQSCCFSLQGSSCH